MRILAIDPGNVESAFCILGTDYRPGEKGKVLNEELVQFMLEHKDEYDRVIIEMVACYGMAVGKSVFDTCVWIGRFTQLSQELGKEYDYIFRKEEKINLCNSMKAKDSNIRQALIDRFGEVGVKKNPGFFYGFKADIWSAFAVGCTYLDKEKSYKGRDK